MSKGPENFTPVDPLRVDTIADGANINTDAAFSLNNSSSADALTVEDPEKFAKRMKVVDRKLSDAAALAERAHQNRTDGNIDLAQINEREASKLRQEAMAINAGGSFDDDTVDDELPPVLEGADQNATQYAPEASGNDFPDFIPTDYSSVPVEPNPPKNSDRTMESFNESILSTDNIHPQTVEQAQALGKGFDNVNENIQIQPGRGPDGRSMGPWIFTKNPDGSISGTAKDYSLTPEEKRALNNIPPLTEYPEGSVPDATQEQREKEEKIVQLVKTLGILDNKLVLARYHKSQQLITYFTTQIEAITREIKVLRGESVTSDSETVAESEVPPALAVQEEPPVVLTLEDPAADEARRLRMRQESERKAKLQEELRPGSKEHVRAEMEKQEDFENRIEKLNKRADWIMTFMDLAITAPETLSEAKRTITKKCILDLATRSTKISDSMGPQFFRRIQHVAHSMGSFDARKNPAGIEQFKKECTEFALYYRNLARKEEAKRNPTYVPPVRKDPVAPVQRTIRNVAPVPRVDALPRRTAPRMEAQTMQAPEITGWTQPVPVKKRGFWSKLFGGQ